MTHALRPVHDVLLAPLAHADDDAWLRAACAALVRACGAGAGFVVAAPRPDDGSATRPLRFLGVDFPERYLRFMAAMSPPTAGTVHSEDDAVQRFIDVTRDERERGGVLLTADVADACADDIARSPIYQEVGFPCGLPGTAALLARGGWGECFLVTCHPRLTTRPFGDATRRVLAPLLPAFAAGLDAVARLAQVRHAFDALLDALAEAALVYDADARHVVARNGAALRLTALDAQWVRVEEVALRVARAAAWPARAHARTGSAARAPAASCATAQARYRLHATRLPAGTFDRGERTLVLVRRETPVVPDAHALARRFGLTPREGEVTRLLAEGAGNREIAARLGVSPHTVRAHAERVFAKLGVRSRKALALRLLEG